MSSYISRILILNSHSKLLKDRTGTVDKKRRYPWVLQAILDINHRDHNVLYSPHKKKIACTSYKFI